MTLNHFERNRASYGKKVQVCIDGTWHDKPVLQWVAKCPLVEHDGIRYNPPSWDWRYPAQV